jgi:DNA (cytosine-5)-methyltransferase 1
VGEKLRFLDLFAGIGGFRLALELAGHKCVGFCEIDEFARQIYKTNFDTEGEVDWEDITEVTDSEARELGGKVDLITAGFPCQAFSFAGKRRGFEDTRGTMFFEIARIAKQIEPRFLLLENVKGLLSHDKGRTFAIILSTLDELGYDVEWQVLNSKDFGVPQNRERVFIVGHSRRFPRREIFPITRTSGQTLKEITQGLADAYRVYDPAGIARTLKAEAGGVGAKTGLYAIPVLTPDRAEKRQNSLEPKIMQLVGDRDKPSLSIKDHAFTIPANPMSDRGQMVVQPVLTPDRAKKGQNGRRFKEPGEPMFTLTAQDRHGVLVSQRTGIKEVEVGCTLDANYYKGLGSNQERTGVVEGVRIRRLTPLECFRLQGFPDEHFHNAKAAGISDRQLYKRAGNAVTVNVVYEIARRLQND